LFLNIRAHVDGLSLCRHVPSRIEVTHTAGQVGAAPVTGFNTTGILSDAIVDRINRFNEFLQQYGKVFLLSLKKSRTLYILSHKTPTFLSSVGSWNLSAMMPLPKCL
jgi:hypothetical protein